MIKTLDQKLISLCSVQIFFVGILVGGILVGGILVGGILSRGFYPGTMNMYKYIYIYNCIHIYTYIQNKYFYICIYICLYVPATKSFFFLSAPPPVSTDWKKLPSTVREACVPRHNGG